MALQALDVIGNNSTITLVTFTSNTLPNAHIAGNVILQAPGTLTLSGIGTTDNGSISQYLWSVDGAALAEGSSLSQSFTYSVSGVYTYSLTVLDNSDEISSIALHVVTVLADNVKPANPSNLNVSSLSTSSGTAVWSASTDNDMVAGYTVSIDGVQVNAGLVNVTNFGLTGLAPATTYTLGVQAVDRAGNRSDIVSFMFSTLSISGTHTTPGTNTNPGVNTTPGVNTASGVFSFTLPFSEMQVGETLSIRINYTGDETILGYTFEETTGRLEINDLIATAVAEGRVTITGTLTLSGGAVLTHNLVLDIVAPTAPNSTLPVQSGWIKVNPNPTENGVQYELTEDATLYTIQGIPVASIAKGSGYLSLADLPAGTYFIKTILTHSSFTVVKR